MDEIKFVESSSPFWHDWYDWFDEQDPEGPLGPRHVGLRQKVYLDGLPAGVKPFRLEEETQRLVRLLGDGRRRTLFDVGCGDARWMGGVHKSGYQGLVVGVEPNAGQFGGRPYWDGRDGRLDLKKQNPLGKLLVKATAQDIPFEDGVSDLTFAQLALYHIAKPEQSSALQELGRITGDGGAVVITTRGEKNKRTMRETRQRIAACLTELLGEEIIPPANVNSDFTTEHGRILLPQHFRYTYEFSKENENGLIFDTPEKFDVLKAAQATFRGLYHTVHGEPLIFPWATDIDAFYRKRYDLAFEMAEEGKRENIRKEPIIDSQHDTVFVCSNEPLPSLLERGYKRLTLVASIDSQHDTVFAGSNERLPSFIEENNEELAVAA